MSSFFGGGGSLGASVESSEITDLTIVNADVSASAAIALSKIDTAAAATFTTLSATADSNQLVLDSDGNATTITAAASGAVTLTLPDATDTLVGKATTDTFTNKTFDANGTGNSLSNVDVADLASGTDGELITWDASGDPATVAVGTSGQILTSNGAGAAPTFQAAAGGGGKLLQRVVTSSTTQSSTTTSIPGDDTIPQNTEGAEYITVSITPGNASNRLLITFIGSLSSSLSAGNIYALFQDSTADALAANRSAGVTSSSDSVCLRYEMAAGTTSATTFKIRYGPEGSGTAYINQTNGADTLGGTSTCTLVVEEVEV